jgi:aquaporin Z
MADELSGGRIGTQGIAIAPGLVVAAMVYSVGQISGAHLNPAVTAGFAVTGSVSWTTGVAYCGAQMLGAILAAAMLRLALGEVADVGAHAPSAGGLGSLAMEVVLTFSLMFVIMAVVSNKEAVGRASGLAVGGTVALCVFVGDPVSGGSMNPARAAGPALLGWAWKHHWVYWVGTITGATIAAASYAKLHAGRHSMIATQSHDDRRLR